MTSARSVLLCLATALIASLPAVFPQARGASDDRAPERENAMVDLHFLEIVTPEMDTTIALLSELHGVTFGDPQMQFGNSRLATLKSGGRLSVRKPMHDAEQPAVRPYVLVDDVEAAFEAAQKAGGQPMVPPMEIPGEGKFALFMLGGIEHGVWQR